MHVRLFWARRRFSSELTVALLRCVPNENHLARQGTRKDNSLRLPAESCLSFAQSGKLLSHNFILGEPVEVIDESTPELHEAVYMAPGGALRFSALPGPPAGLRNPEIYRSRRSEGQGVRHPGLP